MQGIVKVCSKIVGTPLNDLQDLYKVLEEGESHSGWPQSSLVGWIYAAAIRAQSVTMQNKQEKKLVIYPNCYHHYYTL